MASHVYAQLFTSLFAKSLGSGDAYKLLLTTSAYVPNQATDRFQSDANAHEVSGTGYTAGGISLSGVTLTNTGGVFTFTASTADYGTLTVSGIRIAVLYDSTPGSAATNPLLWFWDIGADQAPAGVDFQIQFNASGIFTVTPS